MFFFGENTELVVKYYFDKTARYVRPYPDVPLSEMTQEEARKAYVHSRVAYKQAAEDGVAREVLDALKDSILDHFRYVIAFSDDIADSIEKGVVYPLAATAEEYKKIMKEVRHPSSADAG